MAGASKTGHTSDHRRGGKSGHKGDHRLCSARVGWGYDLRASVAKTGHPTQRQTIGYFIDFSRPADPGQPFLPSGDRLESTSRFLISMTTVLADFELNLPRRIDSCVFRVDRALTDGRPR